MKIHRIAWEGASSVKDTVNMFAIREIGKNIPIMKFTYFVEETNKWLQDIGPDSHEIVRITIVPYHENL